MKLPLIKALRTVSTDQHVDLNQFVSFKQEIYTEPTSFRRTGVIVRTSADFHVEQTVLNGEGFEQADRRAKEIIARRIYEPVTERLYQILETIYQEGPNYDEKVGTAVKELINDMRVW